MSETFVEISIVFFWYTSVIWVPPQFLQLNIPDERLNIENICIHDIS